MDTEPSAENDVHGLTDYASLKVFQEKDYSFGFSSARVQCNHWCNCSLGKRVPKYGLFNGGFMVCFMGEGQLF